MGNIRVFIKWALSFLKSDWVLADYPVRLKEQDRVGEEAPRYSAQIINWWQISGLGNTKDGALEDLNQMFLNIKENRVSMPRPGTGLPIEFASSEELDKYWVVASRIIEEVLGFSPDEVFISDESSLWDFPEGDNKYVYLSKIESIFKLDVSNIESGCISEISKFIHDKMNLSC